MDFSSLGISQSRYVRCSLEDRFHPLMSCRLSSAVILSIAIGCFYSAPACWGFQEESPPPTPPRIKSIDPSRKIEDLRGDPLMQIIEQRLTPEGKSNDTKSPLLDTPLGQPDGSVDGKSAKAIELPPADGNTTVHRPMRLKRENISSKQLNAGVLQAAEGMIRSAKQLEKEARRAERDGHVQRARALRELIASIQRDVVTLLQLGG